MNTLEVMTSHKTDKWNTPKEVVADVIRFFGTIDLDPCCNDINNPNVLANRYYTEETDGLAHEWIADSVYMNHPYSDSKNWIPYAKSQYENGNSKEMILLVKLDVSTRWWKSISAYPFIAVNTRLKFGESNNSAPFQSAIVYLGDNIPKFERIFGKYGFLYMRVNYKISLREDGD